MMSIIDTAARWDASESGIGRHISEEGVNALDTTREVGLNTPTILQAAPKFGRHVLMATGGSAVA